MECFDYERAAHMARGPCAGLQLNFRSGGPARPVVLEPPPERYRAAAAALPPDLSDMDEISYWIHTKRAPCLMNYDNVIKKQNDEARSSRMRAADAEPSPRRKKAKRKLSLLDVDSDSSGKRQNVYFDVSQVNDRPVNECKSNSFDSDLDFNVKNTSVGEKPKRVRLQKSTRTLLHKKNKVVTSTPKTNTIVNLRRSLRQAQLNNSHLNNSFEIFNSNGALGKHVVDTDLTEKVQKTEIFASGDQTTNKRQSSQRNKSKNATNGQFEDYSDVSGFTANYIRSTKVQVGKTPRKLRCKPSRNLGKNVHDSDMIVCVNKSMNTGLPEPNVLDCSTDSSQNIINLVTSKNTTNSNKVDKTTSLLKFMESKTKCKERKINGKQKKPNLNISFQSQSSGTSRYPKRHRNHTDNTEIVTSTRRSNKNGLEFNNSDKKENPDEKIARRRSGRSTALNAAPRDNSVLVVSNSTEQMSSSNINASSPLAKPRKKRRSGPRRGKKSLNRSVPTQKDSSRHKSGFTACFSSDDDSVPLVQRKFFCN